MQLLPQPILLILSFQSSSTGGFLKEARKATAVGVYMDRLRKPYLAQERHVTPR